MAARTATRLERSPAVGGVGPAGLTVTVVMPVMLLCLVSVAATVWQLVRRVIVNVWTPRSALVKV
jgi:hypothetical protein